MSGQIDVRLDLFEEIDRLEKERKAVLLAHFYQECDIQDIADFVGDSLELSRRAAATDADVIVFAGVHFMAETAKILSPSKRVLVPDAAAGCSLADGSPIEKFGPFVAQHSDHVVITYVNTSAAVKAVSDICVTSSNAEKIIRQIPLDQKILFGPDRHLGAYLVRKTGRDMLLWPGSCIVHEAFSEKAIVALQTRYPEAKLLAHPECEESVLAHADFIGSTSGLLGFVSTHDDRTFIIATEEGIIHQMRKAAPDRTFIPAPADASCACNHCPHMRLNTIEKIYLCLRDMRPEIDVPEDIRVRALKPIQRMLEMS